METKAKPRWTQRARGGNAATKGTNRIPFTPLCLGVFVVNPVLQPRFPVPCWTTWRYNHFPAQAKPVHGGYSPIHANVLEKLFAEFYGTKTFFNHQGSKTQRRPNQTRLCLSVLIGVIDRQNRCHLASGCMCNPGLPQHSAQPRICAMLSPRSGLLELVQPPILGLRGTPRHQATC